MERGGERWGEGVKGILEWLEGGLIIFIKEIGVILFRFC